jgi:hypothetical protein
MKLIGYMHGIAAFRETIEEFQPERGVIQRELVDLVRTTYDFQAFPIIQPGAPPLQVLSFSGGKFTSRRQDAHEDSFAIGQLAMTLEGDAVITVTTEQADLVLDDLIRLLDKKLGFHLESSKKTKLYVSHVVVEFDKGLEEFISKLARIADIINETRPGIERFNLKRIVFGMPDRAIQDTITRLQMTDFLIERRVGRPFEENRYFCTAPMPTRDHIRALERIEAIARGSSG